MIRGDVSVRALAESICRSGDLYSPSQGRPVEADEGIAVQKAVQAQRAGDFDDYQREVAVQTEFVCGGETRRLKGRADGVFSDGGLTVIEEFKACRELPREADSADMAQAMLYCGLFMQRADAPQSIKARLVYVQTETLQEAQFEAIMSADDARRLLAFILLCFSVRQERHQRHLARRTAWADELSFPMPAYRPSQQAIARRVYKAIRQGENLLLEAPTGSGKSLGVLFPAVKALQADEQLFFLTSRNAGARAALSAVRQIDPRAETIRVVELTAKEKICPVEGMPCDASRCPYAAGYFDRIGAAVNALLAQRLADREAILQTAEAHTVCPFELSLDAAVWADVVCGDYNYIFDPVVRLKRFSGHTGLHLLVDEAHQLSPRARDMLGVSISRPLKQARHTAHTAMGKRVAALDRALMALRRQHGEGQHHGVTADAVNRACSRFLETAAEAALELDVYPELAELYLTVWRWQRSDAWYDAACFEHLLVVSGRHVQLARVCLDPASYLKGVYAEHGSVVRFSATVSPLPLYQRLHGAQDAPRPGSERAGSPFTAAQSLVLVVPDIPTYYRQRQHSLPQLAALLCELVEAKPGRYMVALPSYDYLQALSGLSAPAWGEVFAQAPGMDAAASESLLAAFAAAKQGVLFIVMGGIFGESVDFAAFALRGVVMVGLGLPPPSAERALIENYFDAAQGAGWGRMVAYTQPALVKNIQAAGRLIRSERDRGVICLVDPRFTSAEVQRFFPAHWQPTVARAREVTHHVTRFWQQHEEVTHAAS